MGIAKKPYLVHSSLITSNSKTIRAMCEGDWAESHSQEVDWSGWEECTVKHYLDWIYTGSYSVSEYSEDCDTAPTEEEIETSPEPSVQNSLFDTIRPLTPLSVCFTFLPAEAPYDTSQHDGDFSAISMAHAKIYVLAQYTNTPALENDALKRLHKLLVQLPPSKDLHIIESVVNLVQYVYANTNALVNSEEPMRRVISTFCAVRFFELLGQPAFQKLQYEGGDFMVDFWEKAGRLIEWERNTSDEDRKKSNEASKAWSKAYDKLKVECTSLRGENKALIKEVTELKKTKRK